MLFKRFAQANMATRLIKCIFAAEDIEFIGHQLRHWSHLDSHEDNGKRNIISYKPTNKQKIPFFYWLGWLL